MYVEGLSTGGGGESSAVRRVASLHPRHCQLDGDFYRRDQDESPTQTFRTLQVLHRTNGEGPSGSDCRQIPPPIQHDPDSDLRGIRAYRWNHRRRVTPVSDRKSTRLNSSHHSISY